MKSDIRRMAERLLDISLNQSQTGRIIGRNRDTVRRMRLRAQDAALTVEKLADLTDSELRKILMPSRTRKSGCLPPDLDAAARHIMRTGDSMLDYYEDRRQRSRIERLTQAAQFKYVNANPKAIDYSKDRKLDKAHVLDLVKCEWISRGQNMVITGASGTGKTWLACALGNSAVRHEKSTRYVRTSRLVEELNFARLDGSLTKLRTKIARLDLLILDDFALLPMGPQEKADLFEVIEDQDERASTMLISQRPIADWYEFVGEDLLADAFLDRVRNRTHRIQLEGKSKRG